LLLRSEEFDDAAWTKTNSTITADTIVAPDGTLTGDKLVENTATSEHTAAQNFTFVSGTTYTKSVYVKKAERTLVRIGAGNPLTWGAAAVFDLSSGVATSVTAGTATIQPVGNDWYRLTVTGIALASAATGVSIRLVSTGTTINYTGDGYSGIYVWGAQLESSGFSSSYIKTEASQVTRSTDVASMTGNNFLSWYRQDQGTLYVEAAQAKGGSPSLFAVDDNTASNRIIAYCPSETSAGYRVVSSGTDQANINVGSIALQANFKLAFGYEVNNFAGSLNGSAVAPDTSGVVPSNISVARIGTNVSSGVALNGTIKKLAFYPERLDNTQLQALTS
jgi:hypothetical protein